MPPRRWDLGEVLKLFLSSQKVSMENPATLASRRNLTASYLKRGAFHVVRIRLHVVPRED